MFVYIVPQETAELMILVVMSTLVLGMIAGGIAAVVNSFKAKRRNKRGY